MAKRKPRLCKDCKFCLRLFDYEDESHILFCDNINTKSGRNPIGFLRYDAQQCEYFEDAQVEPNDPRVEKPRRHWLLMMINGKH